MRIYDLFVSLRDPAQNYSPSRPYRHCRLGDLVGITAFSGGSVVFPFRHPPILRGLGYYSTGGEYSRNMEVANSLFIIPLWRAQN